MSYLNFHILIILVHTVIKLTIARAVHHVAVALGGTNLVSDNETSHSRLNLYDHRQLVRCQLLRSQLSVVVCVSSESVVSSVGVLFSAALISHCNQIF